MKKTFYLANTVKGLRLTSKSELINEDEFIETFYGSLSTVIGKVFLKYQEMPHVSIDEQEAFHLEAIEKSIEPTPKKVDFNQLYFELEKSAQGKAFIKAISTRKGFSLLAGKAIRNIFFNDIKKTKKDGKTN